MSITLDTSKRQKQKQKQTKKTKTKTNLCTIQKVAIFKQIDLSPTMNSIPETLHQSQYSGSPLINSKTDGDIELPMFGDTNAESGYL